jgi:hypothetical protein
LVFGKSVEVREIHGARAMDSVQGWRWVKRLILALYSMEGIKEKLFQTHR